MTTIGDLLVHLGVDATELNRGFAASEKTIERLGTQLFFLGSRVTAGVSVPLTAAIGVIAKFGLEFDKAMTESLAIMNNVTPQIRKEMEAVAISVSETTKFSAKEAAEGYYALASAGLDAATTMGALPIAAQFAQAGVMDLAKATDYLAAAQAALGGTTDSSAQKVADMAKIADVLTQANNMALGTVQDFAEALTNKAGQQMRLFNVSVEEGVAVLAAYASMGIKGKAAGQQLHMMLRDLARANIRNSEEWKKHNIAVFDSAGNMRNLGAILKDLEARMEGATDKQRRQILMTLGMQDRSLAATQALIGMSGAIADYEKGLLAAGGTTQRVADNQMKALTNQLLKLVHEAQNVAIELFKAFVPTITGYIIPALRTLLEMVRSVGNFFSTLPEPLKLVALGLVGIGIAIGPVTLGLGSLILTGSAVARAIIGITGALGPMSLALASATGAQVAYSGALQTSNMVQNAVATGMGITASKIAPVVLSQTQLTAAINTASTAAMAGARAMGQNAVGIINAGVAAENYIVDAQLAAKAQLAMNAALTAAVPRVSLFTRALLFLANPLVWIPALVLGFGAAWLVYRQKQEAARQSMIDTSEEFRRTTSVLESNIVTYRALKDAQALNEEQSTALTVAIRNLSEATGISTRMFDGEKESTDRVTAAIERQIRARKALFDTMVNITRAEVIEAERAAGEVKWRLEQAIIHPPKRELSIPGAWSVQIPTAEGSPEHIVKVGELTAELAKVNKAAEEAREKLRKLLGEPERGAPIVGVIRDVANQTRLAFMLPEGLPEPGVGIVDPNLEKMRDKEIAALRDRMIAEGKNVVEIGEAIAEVNRQWAQVLNVGKQPLGVDLGEESEAEKAAKRLKDQISEMKAALMGTGGKDMQVLSMAWSELMKSSKGAVAENVSVVENLWVAYSKLRDEYGLINPELERITENQRRQAETTQYVNEHINMWGDVWSDTAHKFVDNIGDITVAMANMGAPEMEAFFKRHGGVLDELIPFYNQLPPLVQGVIDKYQMWGIQVSKTNSQLDANWQKAKVSIKEFSEDVTAKLQDSQTELSLFSKNYSERELVGLRKGLATQRKELERNYEERLQLLRENINQSGVMEFLAQKKILDETRDAGYERLRIEERIGQLRILAALGVNQKLLYNNKKYSKDELDELIIRFQAWRKYFDDLKSLMDAFASGTELVGLIGQISNNQWMIDFAKGMEAVNQGIGTMVGGMERVVFAGGDITEVMAGVTESILGAVQALYAMSQMGERSQRVLAGAMAGFQVGGFWGAGIGALAGLFMDDPRWAKIQDDVEERFDAIISEELSRKIEQDFRRLNSMLEAEFRNMAAIIEEAGGLDSANVGEWADRLVGVFERIDEVRRNFANLEAFRAGTERPTIGWDVSEAQALATAAESLNEVFPMLAEAGMTANGVLNQQVVELIKLDRAYQTGSKAVKEFVDAQLGMVAEGFNKIVAGTYAPFADLFSGAEGDRTEMDKLIDKIERYRAVLEDFEAEPPKNAKQRAQQAITIRQLETAEKKLAALEKKAAAGEEALERMFTQRGAADALNADIAALTERAEELTEKIEEAKAAGEDPSKFEMDLSETLAEIDALRDRQRDLTAESQEQFDRMGRLASATFYAMTASGKSIVEAIEAIGPGLDILADAMNILGFEASGSLNELFRFREFIDLNPALIDMLDGINQMLKGLHNSGFMTAEAFRDLGATALDVFNEMTQTPELTGIDEQIQGLVTRADELRQKIIEARLAGEDPIEFQMQLDTVLADIDLLRQAQADVAAGALTSNEAMRLMQPTLQTLWEMQRAFGYEVDENTQRLLDQAEAEGLIGRQFMSATDRMAIGIDRIVTLLETWMRYLKIDIPESAYDAADAMNNAFDGVNPEIEVEYRYKQVGPNPTPDDAGAIDIPDGWEGPRYASGAHLVNQPHLAMVGDSEEWIIRDPTFRDIMDEAAMVGAASVAKTTTPTGGNMIINVHMEGRKVAEVSVPYIPDVVRDLRLV